MSEPHVTEETPGAHGHVIVAVDGSPAAANAVDWAADEAMLRGVDLEILHAWEWTAYEASDWYGQLLHNQGAETVETAAERARRRRPDVHVTTTIEHGYAPDVVTGATERAGLVVLGNRGRGGFAGLLLGSVSSQVVSHAPCPVVVVPPAE